MPYLIAISMVFRRHFSKSLQYTLSLLHSDLSTRLQRKFVDEVDASEAYDTT